MLGEDESKRGESEEFWLIFYGWVEGGKKVGNRQRGLVSVGTAEKNLVWERPIGHHATTTTFHQEAF